MNDVPEQKMRMLHGELYRADGPELVADRQRCRDLLERFNATSATEPQQGQAILHDLLGHLGRDSVIMPRFVCDYGYQIRIGDRSFINYNAVFLDSAAVTIGDDVQIGPSVQLLTATHPLDAATRRTGYESAAPITIGYAAWLGGGVIICPGVTVGDEAVIGAGSVVARDIPPRVLAAGNPARVIRSL
ncbi:MAG TPA: sugar O-acetyltransferase [Micromonosporaceae bacterium]